MPVSALLRGGALIALALVFPTVGVRSDAVAPPSGRMALLPRVTLWAWERREDLHTIDTRRFAVAYLDQTLTIDSSVRVQPRRDPVVFPEVATRIPVVRIETTKVAVLDPANQEDAVKAILRSAQEPGVAALQIDFDATRSERMFYRNLLIAVRRRMPVGLPLSITALASWCSWDRWIRDLPVDEAVPMMFRMEPDRRRALPDDGDFQIREPLCRDSVGVSTTEPWPGNLEGKRIYIFADNGWYRDWPASLKGKVP
jgi:hypothetical protein